MWTPWETTSPVWERERQLTENDFLIWEMEVTADITSKLLITSKTVGMCTYGHI